MSTGAAFVKKPLPDATIRILSHLNNTLNIPRGKALSDEDFADIAEHLPEDNVIRRLVNDIPAGKAALAELYLKYATDGSGEFQKLWTSSSTVSRPRQVFFESGSTLVYVADALKQQWSSSSPLPEPGLFLASTNNNLVALLYLRERSSAAPNHLGLPRWPPFTRLFPGYLEPKYHGIFPFYGNESELRRREEQLAYADCRWHLSQSQLLLLAASRLSLIHGPLVGSRENSIFKNACYNSCVPPMGMRSEHEVHLFITADKLILHGTPPSDAFPNTLDGEMEKLNASRCFPVFSIPKDHDAPTKWLCKEDVQPLPDGTRVVRLGSMRFRVCDSWLNLFSKAGVKIKVFLVYECAADADVIKREVIIAQDKYARDGVEFGWDGELGKTTVLGQEYILGTISIGGLK